MGKWFCIWQFSDNRKINLNLEPKPAVVPERYRAVEPKLRRQIQFENKQLFPPNVFKAEA